MNMLRQCCIYAVPNQVLERITFRRKVNNIVTRAYYNDKQTVTFLSQDLHKRQNIDDAVKEKYSKIIRNPPRSRTKLLLGTTEAPNIHDFTTFNFKEWWAKQKQEYRKYVQRKEYEKHLTLGPDIATARFVLRCGGRVKFKGHEEWIELANRLQVFKELPNTYDPSYILEGIDLKGHPIEFDNLFQISNLYELKWLSLKGCKTVDDWYIDKLSTGYPMLEHFDISECINVTERALESLYRMPNLKKLIITNFYKSVAMELTCLMLEDVNPFLECEILEPKEKLLPSY